jgi:hypothetical protein
MRHEPGAYFGPQISHDGHRLQYCNILLESPAMDVHGRRRSGGLDVRTLRNIISHTFREVPYRSQLPLVIYLYSIRPVNEKAELVVSLRYRIHDPVRQKAI